VTREEQTRKLWLLRAACFFQGLGFGIQWSFSGVWMKDQGLVALVALPLTGMGVDRFGTRLLLAMAFVAQPLRALSLSLIGQYEWLLLPHIFHFFTWAGFEVAGVLFVASLAAEGSRATAQTLYVGA